VSPSWFRNDSLVEAKRRLAAGEPCSWETARDILDKLPFHPVVCLDEFEALLSEEFDNRFFNGLRSWANEGVLSWVTASAKPMEELAELRGLTSPFFNLLATITLAGLTDAEVEQLLSLADNTTNAFSNADKRIIYRLANTNPYHLQIVASQLWQMKTSGKVNKKAIERFLCQQPEPPAYCRRFRWHKAWMIVAVLLAVVLLLVAVLIWQAPGFVAQVFTKIESTGRVIGDELGWWSDAIAGLAILGGLWQAAKHHQSISEFFRNLMAK
jgi:hypothetical protein